MYRLFPVALVTLPALAQTSHTVGPGGFAQITDALAVAAPGDTILVQPGQYAPFVATIGVSIVAPQGAVVRSPQTSPQLDTRLQIPAGQTAYVSGFSFEAPALYAHKVVVNGGGQVAFAHCEFRGPHPYDDPSPALSGANVDLVLVKCSTTGWGGFSFGNGMLAASDCAFHGKNRLSTTAASLPGVSLGNCRAQFASCTIAGAPGDASVSWSQAASAGAVIGGISDVEFVDSSIAGGNAINSPTAAPGLESTSPFAVRHDRSSFTGGSTTNFPNGPLTAPGIVGLAQSSPSTGLVGAPNGLRAGQGYTYTATAEPASLVVIGVTFGLVPASVPLFVRCDPAQVFLDTIGVTDPNGTFVRAPLPPLPVAAIGRPLWFHGFALGSAGLLTSVPVGGLVR